VEAVALLLLLLLTVSFTQYYFSSFFGTDGLFILLEQLQHLAVERFLINTSMASLEEAKISSSILNQRLLQAANHQAFSGEGSLDSLPTTPGRLHSSAEPTSHFTSPSLPTSFSFPAGADPPHRRPSASFSAIQSALNEAQVVPKTPSSFETLKEDLLAVTEDEDGQPQHHQRVGGGGLDGSTPILSTSDLLMAKTKNEQFQGLFKIPFGETLLMGACFLCFMCEVGYSFIDPPVEFAASLWWQKRWFKGRCFVSDNFLCFSYTTSASHHDFISVQAIFDFMELPSVS